MEIKFSSEAVTQLVLNGELGVQVQISDEENYATLNLSREKAFDLIKLLFTAIDLGLYE